MTSELEQLKKEYVEKTNQNQYKTEMYALMGSTGVSPEYIKTFEESLKLIDQQTPRRKNEML